MKADIWAHLKQLPNIHIHNNLVIFKLYSLSPKILTSIAM